MNIFSLKLSSSNAFLLQTSQNILFDTGLPNDLPKLEKMLNEKGVGLADIHLIIHTHGHGDHCGTTAELQKKYSIPTVIHIADKHMSDTGKNEPNKSYGLTAKLIKPFIDKPYTPFIAEFYLNEESKNQLEKYDISGFWKRTPGHTDGSISWFFENGTAITGDVVMGGYLGGMIQPHKPEKQYYYKNIAQLKTSVQTILEQDCDTICVGHGGPIKKADLKIWFKKEFE